MFIFHKQAMFVLLNKQNDESLLCEMHAVKHNVNKYRPCYRPYYLVQTYSWNEQTTSDWKTNSPVIKSLLIIASSHYEPTDNIQTQILVKVCSARPNYKQINFITVKITYSKILTSCYSNKITICLCYVLCRMQE